MLKKTALLAVLFALLLAPTMALANGAKPGAEKLTFYHASEKLQCPRYCRYKEEGATGKLIINQPNGEVSVVLTVIFDGLKPDTEYTLYRAKTEWVEGGVWPGGEQVGTVVTDEYGHMDFHMNVLASDWDTGEYTWSIWVNDWSLPGIGADPTVFVSENFKVTID